MKKLYLIPAITLIILVCIFSEWTKASDGKNNNFQHLDVNFNEDKILVFNKETGKLYVHKLVSNTNIWNNLVDNKTNSTAIQIDQTGSRISLAE